MSRRTDTGDGGGAELSEIQRGFALPLFHAEGGVDLPVLDPPEEGGERHQLDGGVQQRELLRQICENGRQEIQLHMIVASNLKGDKMLMPAQAFLCQQGGLQDELRVCKEKNALLRERDALARALEQGGFQLGLQRADLMADRGLGHLQFFGRPREIQMLCHREKAFQLCCIHNNPPRHR